MARTPTREERLQKLLADIQHHLASANRSVSLNPNTFRAPSAALGITPHGSALIQQPHSYSDSLPGPFLPHVADLSLIATTTPSSRGAGDVQSMNAGAALVLVLLSSTFLVLTLGSLCVVLCCVRRRRFRVDQVCADRTKES